MLFGTITSMGGVHNAAPKRIADSELLTAREKLEVLNDLKADVASELAEGEDIGIAPSEIDDAIALVRDRAARGH